MQAGFKADQVRVIGRFNDFARVSDEADRKEQVFHFCPACGHDPDFDAIRDEPAFQALVEPGAAAAR